MSEPRAPAAGTPSGPGQPGRTEDETGRERAPERPVAAGRVGEPPHGESTFGALVRPLTPRPPLPLVRSDSLGTAGFGPLAARALALWGVADQSAATGRDQGEIAPAGSADPAAAGRATPAGTPLDVAEHSDLPLRGDDMARRRLAAARPRPPRVREGDTEHERPAALRPTFGPSPGPSLPDEPPGGHGGAGDPPGPVGGAVPGRWPIPAPSEEAGRAAARPAEAGEPSPAAAPGALRARPAEVSIADLSPASVVFVPAARSATRAPIWAAPEAAFARPPTELLVAAAAADADWAGGRPALARAEVGRALTTASDQMSTIATTEAPAEAGPPADPHQLAEQVYALIKRRLAVESERAGLLTSRRRW
ncbi:MAG TPA: hypothetical protein VGM69_02035 [Chloroflexota bacterium]